MTSDQVRSTFLEFFQARGHHLMPSSSLVPLNDPTVLLTPAGMHQMQPFFLGKAKPPANRLTSSQKCFRTTDIESVGDESHLTFFEMLGNFSVGDYFKEGAIEFAWELLRKGYGVPEERLHVTCHPTDDEAPALWRKVGLPPERIHQDETNWWAIKGSAGPCGPDSEIYYDFGPEHGCGRPDCAPGCDCDRFLEIWNLVFMQFLQDENNEVQAPLQQKNIDTGAGLERLSRVLQGKATVYETDLFWPIIERIQTLTGRAYEPATHRSMRVLADHGRAMTFLVGDGLEPGNEGRGYILRRIIRRAVRHGRLLGLEKSFLKDLAGAVIERMSAAYPNLSDDRERILGVIGAEEERFNQTLAQGMTILESMVENLQAGEQLPGIAAFRLYDTYGFPLEVTQEILAERGFGVDETGFLAQLEQQRTRSRAAAKGGHRLSTSPDVYRDLLRQAGASEFLGYETCEADGKIVGIVKDGQPAQSLAAGEEGEIVLDRTSFYATGGGQVGDTGSISTSQATLEVSTTNKPIADLIVHHGRLVNGELRVGDSVHASVNEAARWDTARNHTGTHILHAALRQVLGEKATQAGSVVEPDRLRFDFHWSAPLTDEQIREVERIANEQIRRNEGVQTEVLSQEQAFEKGAIGLFEEKYGDQVRVVSIPGYSMELCGGTHCRATGQIGELVIVSQESVGSGVRRIEAYTGRKAAEYVRERLDALRAATQALPGSSEAELPKQIQRLLEELSRKDKQIERLKREGGGSGGADQILAKLKSANGATQVLAESLEADNRNDLLMVVDRIKPLQFTGVVTLGAVIDGKPAYVTVVTKDLVARGVQAGDIVRAASLASGGAGGGGRPDLAQGGGKDPAKLADGLRAALEAAQQRLAPA
ncbi:MAG TPA: alanine--tRNA ligase [Chloroflexota bacterium]|nr:alanine--tRNA ligase [Chloroflexota bacterium]